MSVKHLTPIDSREPAVSFWTDIIKTHSAPGDVVLVPFAQDATIAKAALEQARRVVLLVRTPAQQLRLWGRLVPVDDADRQRALTRLAATAKRDTPLDLYVQSLYETACPDCGEPTPATAFIWDSAHRAPVEKDLACDACGFAGRAPADDGDARRAAQFEPHGLSFWFILEWLVDAQDTPGRGIARRRLDEYSPRSLAALADITRKIDAELSDDPASQRILRLWLLHALDAGRQRPAPAEESAPGRGEGVRTIERNVWHLLTHAPPADDIDAPVRLTSDLEGFFPEPLEVAQSGSEPMPDVAVIAGPLRRLARQLPAESVTLILGAPPVLGVDAWIWEQLWSRWVFGRAAAGGLQPPIGGWERHVRALRTTLSVLMPALRADGQLVFRFQDEDPNRVGALLMAMAAYASLEEFVYQPPLVEPAHLFDAAGGTYAVAFAPEPSVTPPGTKLDPQHLAEATESAAVAAAVNVISARAEPLPYGWILAAAEVSLARSGLLHQAMAALDADMSPLTFTRQHVRQGLRAALAEGRLIAVSAFGPAAGAPEDKSTHWWLPQPLPTEPLSEQVEQALIDLFRRESTVTPADVYQRFSGWLTPEEELVEALLSAYGVEVEAGVWRQRPVDPEEQPAIARAIHHLGKQLEFSVGTGIADVVWGEGGHATHAFRILETGRWSELEIDALPAGVAGYIILPDRLVNLFRVKLMRNPLWRRDLAEYHWTPIKARHVLAMAEEPDVDRQEFKKILGLDPIIEQAEAQIPLF